MNYIYLELPKFIKKEEELETPFEKWLFAFRWLGHLQKRPKALQDRVFRKLFKIAEIAKFNKMERLQYEESLKQLRDNENVVNYARKEGIEEGASKERLTTIKRLLGIDCSFEIIAKATGLSIKELKAIIKEQGW